MITNSTGESPEWIGSALKRGEFGPVLRQMKRTLLMVFTAGSLTASLSACSSMEPFPFPDMVLPNGEPATDVVGIIRKFWPDPIPAEERTWRNVKASTTVTGVTDDTIRLQAYGGPLRGIETVEFRLLARAAAEGVERGYPYFQITHLRDRNYASAGRLFGMPLYSGPMDAIGSYDELVESRYERDWAAAPRAWSFPGLTAVIEYTNEPPTRRQPRFEVESLYRNLIIDGEME